MTPVIAPRASTSLAAFALAAALVSIPGSLPALDSDREEPLYLEADSAEFSEVKLSSTYTGNVFLKQGSKEFRGDQVTVRYDAEWNPALITATGAPASYRQQVKGEKKKPIRAQALRMEYDRATNKITLIDQAVLSQGEDTFRNDRIIYDFGQARIQAGAIAKGKERVKIVIHPARR